MVYNHWDMVCHLTGIDVKTVKEADEAFKLDMNLGDAVDGNYVNYKLDNPDRMFYDDLTPDQKEKFRVSGLYWDRIGRIGSSQDGAITRDQVLEILN